MKHDLKSYRAASKYCTTQDKATDANRPHHAFNRFADFPADQAGAAADEILQRIHWVIHEASDDKFLEIIDGSPS
jgi:hypothetical protein